MAELDFSKIFGETATSKVSLTDENYLNGWGYLGSTPPPYQLFDYLQSLNDKKSKYLYDKTIENDNKLALHNTNATAHADIRAKITSEINSHNSNTSAHATILNAHNADVNAHSVAFGKVLQKSDIKVITGEVANGGTIPLPDGFLESECNWFAGIKHSNVNEWRFDPNEGYRSNLLAPMCTLNGRVVTVGTQVAGIDGGSYTADGPVNFGSALARAFMPGTAWYMCIGIHG